eukprot:8620842-Pyramimonas_sp.AAC.1
MDFNDAVEQHVLELALMEALKMVAPMEGADGSWVFHRESDLNKIKNLRAPMSTSQVFLKKKQGKRSNVKAKTAPPMKKPKKGTQDEALVLNVPAEEIHDTVSADSPNTSRNTLFFDDLVNAICQPLQHLPIARYNTEVIRELFKFGFIFCFEGAVTIRGEMYTDWSKVRKIFRDDSIRAHRGDLMVKECEIAHGDADAGAASSFAGPSVGNVQAVNDALSQFVGDEKFVLGMFAIVRQTKMPDIL